MLGISLHFTSTKGMLETYSLIEQKSHHGYSEFVSKLEDDKEDRSQFIAEFVASNMFEAELMHLWLNHELKKYQH